MEKDSIPQGFLSYKDGMALITHSLHLLHVHGHQLQRITNLEEIAK
jgi:hypothetical protein